MSLFGWLMLWGGVSVGLFIVSFFLMNLNLHDAKRHWNDYRKSQHEKRAMNYMWISLLAPLWPLVVFIGPALLIKWVVGQYRQTLKFAVGSKR